MFKGKGDTDKHGEKVKTSKHAKKDEGSETGAVIYKENKEPLTFIVNLAGGKNFLKLDMALEISDKETEKEIEEKMPKVKDTILMILSEQTIDSLSDNKGKLRLKDDIMKRLNHFLAKGKIQNIYFTGFVVQ